MVAALARSLRWKKSAVVQARDSKSEEKKTNIIRHLLSPQNGHQQFSFSSADFGTIEQLKELASQSNSTEKSHLRAQHAILSVLTLLPWSLYCTYLDRLL